MLYLIEILHQTTTMSFIIQFVPLLYLIEILHQTTTTNRIAMRNTMLYLIEILHQTTTIYSNMFIRNCCILSKFYIKPQPPLPYGYAIGVVSYRNSTSNHNVAYFAPVSSTVVSYRNSTSNHNYSDFLKNIPPVVSYRNSTSNHNNRFY